MTRFVQHRAGAGAPLVLIHGLGADWRSWRPVLGALEAEHDVIAVDLPGHGASPRLPGGRPTIGRIAAAIAEDLGELGVEFAHIVGNSVGGRVAVELAVRGRASTLVAISPSGFELPAERAWVFWADQGMRLRARSGAPLRRRIGAHAVTRSLALVGPHVRPWRLSPDDAAHEIACFAGTRAYQSTLLWGGMLDVPRGLRGIECRSRIAFGTADVLLGALTAPRFAATIPRAELVPLWGCGHAPMADDPELVARTILDVTRSP
jgi:pimeloyl-ACP methyl ester carboxylesterase